MAKDGYASLSQRSARFGVAETGSGLLITPSVSPSARITWFLSTCCSVLRPAGSAACCQLEQVLMQRRDSVSTPPAEFSGRWRTRVWLAASRFGVWDVITLTTVAGEYHYRVATPATSWARHWRDLSFKRNESFEKSAGRLGWYHGRAIRCSTMQDEDFNADDTCGGCARREHVPGCKSHPKCKQFRDPRAQKKKR